MLTKFTHYKEVSVQTRCLTSHITCNKRQM